MPSEKVTTGGLQVALLFQTNPDLEGKIPLFLVVDYFHELMSILEIKNQEICVVWEQALHSYRDK